MADQPGAEQVWRDAVARVLKGAAPETLVSYTDDGLPVQPLYPPADTAGPGPWRDPSRPFGIIPRIDHPDPDIAAELARTDLDGGAIGLVLVGRGSAEAYGFGLAPADGAALLDRLGTASAALRFDLASGEALVVLDALLASSGGMGIALDAFDFGFDPLGDRAELLASARALRDRGFAGPVLRADGRPHHAAGASEAQELAAVLSAGVAALRALEPLGLAAAQAALSFTLAVDADQLLTIVKLRALRRLWARVEAACGLAPRPIRLHAETAARMLAYRDCHTNILRTTLAVAAAILGGADSVTVLPHTTPLGLPDAFARRLARNTPLVLLAEAHLGRVADPAAGSGAYETLTADLAAEAWRRFRALEGQGGLAVALASGAWQAEVAAVRQPRAAALVRGDAVRVGVTRFTQSDELPPAVLMSSLTPWTAQGGDRP